MRNINCPTQPAQALDRVSAQLQVPTQAIVSARLQFKNQDRTTAKLKEEKIYFFNCDVDRFLKMKTLYSDNNIDNKLYLDINNRIACDLIDHTKKLYPNDDFSRVALLKMLIEKRLINSQNISCLDSASIKDKDAFWDFTKCALRANIFSKKDVYKLNEELKKRYIKDEKPIAKVNEESINSKTVMLDILPPQTAIKPARFVAMKHNTNILIKI